MTAVILFWYLLCDGGACHVVPFEVTPEAAAIVSCESGDGLTFGTYTMRSRSATHDGGLWQFNDDTYKWLTGRTHADTDAPAAQYAAFLRLWQGGAGWKHWKSSQACWSQWLTVNDEGVAVWR